MDWSLRQLKQIKRKVLINFNKTNEILKNTSEQAAAHGLRFMVFSMKDALQAQMF